MTIKRGNYMTASEKRNAVCSYIFTREGKNQYTQSIKRSKVESGYSDCSSLQQWAYRKIGLEIGDYTGAQILKGSWVQLGGGYPDESKLLPGDELFFSANYDNGRPYRVSHIEMYVGNGQISGHGYGIGPVRKDMVAYCKQRNKAGKPFIGVKRYITVDEFDNKENQNYTNESIYIGICTGNNVNVRQGPGTSYAVITGWPKLNKGNKVEVLEKIGSWYFVRIQNKYRGYVYSKYVEEERNKSIMKKEGGTSTEVSKNRGKGTILERTPKWVGKVTATILNVRNWAGTEHPRIRSWPQLGKGNLIDVCDSIKDAQGDTWYYVRIAGRVYGFVSAAYIEKQ